MKISLLKNVFPVMWKIVRIVILLENAYNVLIYPCFLLYVLKANKDSLLLILKILNLFPSNVIVNARYVK